MDNHEVLRMALNSRVPEILPEPTQLDRLPRLSDRLATSVYLKREDLTPIFSFKIRGAYNRIAQLDDREKARGVIAASAGNHAQGVAWAASKLGIRARLVMPRTTPPIKINAVHRFGAAIDLIGDDYAEAAAFCEEIAERAGMTLIPPYDDLHVVAGQATIALEILRQAPADLACILVPVGGGGLAAGIAAVVKALRPNLRVIGVEPFDSDAMRQSLAAGKRVVMDHVGVFADGVAVRQVGKHTFALCRRYLDGSIVVSTDEICAAIKDVFEETRSVLEPAGALGVAGLKRMAAEGALGAGAAVAIASGANINFDRLGYVAERAAIGEHREALFAVTIPERPGSFLEFMHAIGDRNITEFNYRLGSRDEARILAGIRIDSREEAAELAKTLRRRGYRCEDLTGNDLAKSHLRYMAGGRSPEVQAETLLSFQFPERPGALLKFLSSVGDRWNISLFHYRNHGGAYGRVLCGFEIPEGGDRQLRDRLCSLGFAYRDESRDPAAEFILR